MFIKKFETVSQEWTKSDLRVALNSCSPASILRFKEAFANLLETGADQITPFISARSGLVALLTDLFGGDEETVILVSALNCGVVPESVIESGCSCEYFDLSDESGHFDFESIAAAAPDNCGAVIIPHLYGMPAASREDLGFFRERNIIVIEDCAHILGATVDGQIVGKFGDFSIFSFNFDKPISLGGGGVVWSARPNPSLGEGSATSENPSWIEGDELRRFLRWLFFRRLFERFPIPLGSKTFRFIEKVLSRPFKGRFGNGCQVGFFGPVRAELGRALVERFHKVRETRNNRAIFLLERLKLEFWNGTRNAQPSWLRLRVLLRNREAAAELKRECRSMGFRVGRYNWATLATGESGKRFPNAEKWVNCGVDIPLLSSLTHSDLDRLCKVISKYGDSRP